jgi:fatty acid desaturase
MAAIQERLSEDARSETQETRETPGAPRENRDKLYAPAPAGGTPEASSAVHKQASEVGVHPMIVKIALCAAVWFLAVTWLAFGWGGDTDFLLAIVILFFTIFFTLFLLTASYSVKDPRWPVRETSFREFLGSEVGIGGGTMSGRDVLIETAIIPVTLAFAATLIGLAWVIFG